MTGFSLLVIGPRTMRQRRKPALARVTVTVVRKPFLALVGYNA
jgi:hypothetical protein